MTNEELIEKLKAIVKPYVKNEEGFKNMTENSDFLNDLKINSANLVDVILDVETEFDIIIDNESMEKMLNVKAAMDIITAQTRRKVTGNDIVDIATAAAESNWERAGFLEKIFTQQEQQYIRDAAMPLQMVWRLWSMKESAYKVYTRQKGGRFFAPQKLNCILLSEETGHVTIHNTIFQTITTSTKDYIYSIARPEGLEADFLNDCFSIPQDHTAQQKFIYEKLIACYASIKAEDKDNLTILKDKNNIPFLYCKKDKISTPVSITHHGNYAAFTIN